MPPESTAQQVAHIKTKIAVMSRRRDELEKERERLHAERLRLDQKIYSLASIIMWYNISLNK